MCTKIVLQSITHRGIVLKACGGREVSAQHKSATLLFCAFEKKITVEITVERNPLKLAPYTIYWSRQGRKKTRSTKRFTFNISPLLTQDVFN